MYIGSSMLYDYVKCPHRVWRDYHGPQEERAQETNPFVKLLWEKGVLHEEKVIKTIGEYADIRSGTLEERFEKTMDEMRKGTPLIYQGVLIDGDLMGIPDLLRKLPDGAYIPVDIKSGLGLEGIDENIGGGRMKKHYAVQLCLYAEILKNLGFAKEDRGIILDIRGDEVVYELNSPQGPRNTRTWRDAYLEIREEAGALVAGGRSNKPAITGVCKLCHWYSSCRNWCEKSDDLSRIFYLGRSKRDMLSGELGINRVKDFINLDIDAVLSRKKGNRGFLRGLGEKTLRQMLNRARILAGGGGPQIYGRVDFPAVPTEFFFDIEDDPTQDFVYLHGIYKRESGEEKYVYFFAVENTPMQEKNAWSEFWDYIRKYEPDRRAVYYYSSHEKTVYAKLREKYPDVISEEELERFFGHPNVVDLYSKVLKHTDWPLSSYSVKEIAGYLGFKWRDKTPSGVLSIQWFNEFLANGEPGVFKRIIEYNEDDCKATMVLKDGLKNLSVI